MEMPVIVGIIVAVAFLVAFSEWFYHLVAGWREIVLDDKFFHYRIAGATLLSILFITGTFFVVATINECPNQIREGLFAGLRCDEFLLIKAETGKILGPKDSDLIKVIP